MESSNLSTEVKESKMDTQQYIKTATWADLLAIQAKIERQIKVASVKAKYDALKKVKETAKELGFTLEELINDSTPTKEKAEVAAKYRNPENTEQTWTGRGKKPNWVHSALADGHTLETLLIEGFETKREAPQGDESQEQAA